MHSPRGSSLHRKEGRDCGCTGLMDAVCTLGARHDCKSIVRDGGETMRSQRPGACPVAGDRVMQGNFKISSNAGRCAGVPATGAFAFTFAFAVTARSGAALTTDASHVLAVARDALATLAADLGHMGAVA